MPDAIKEVEVRVSITTGDIPDLPDFASAKGDASSFFALMDTGLGNLSGDLEESSSLFDSWRRDLSGASDQLQDITDGLGGNPACQMH